MVNILKRNSKDEEQVRVIRPPVDIATKNNEVILEVELPGVAKETVNVELHNNTLSIQAKKTKDKTEEKYTPLYLERYTTVEYRREFELNSEVDHKNIKANFDNGVLKLTLTKSTEAQPKKISITSGS